MAGRVGRGFLFLANDEVTAMWINLCLYNLLVCCSVV